MILEKRCLLLSPIPWPKVVLIINSTRGASVLQKWNCSWKHHSGFAPQAESCVDQAYVQYSRFKDRSGVRKGRGEDAVIAGIENRIAEWTHIPPSHGEALQVGRQRRRMSSGVVVQAAA
eukprot:221231-Pelagomonas_calceolata.AAC.4